MSIKQAIEALEEVADRLDGIKGGSVSESIRMLRDSIAALRSMPQGEPYGQVTVVKRPGCQDQHWFYRWPDPPYLDNASECVTVYTQPQTEAVRMSEAEIEEMWNMAQGEFLTLSSRANAFARAVEQATAARLGVKMGDV